MKNDIGREKKNFLTLSKDNIIIMDLMALFKEQVCKLRHGLNHVDSGCH